MNRIYKSDEGEHKVRDRYLAFLKRWPVPNQQIRVATSQGETFVVASGPESAPPLLLFHGGAGNSAMWMGDVPTFANAFRVYSIDMIGEAGPVLELANRWNPPPESLVNRSNGAAKAQDNANVRRELPWQKKATSWRQLSRLPEVRSQCGCSRAGCNSMSSPSVRPIVSSGSTNA